MLPITKLYSFLRRREKKERKKKLDIDIIISLNNDVTVISKNDKLNIY